MCWNVRTKPTQRQDGCVTPPHACAPQFRFPPAVRCYSLETVLRTNGRQDCTRPVSICLLLLLFIGHYGQIVRAAAGGDKALPPVRVNVPRGFQEKPFTLILTTPVEGAAIRYTLDGSAPSPTHGLTFGQPLTVSSNTVLRTAAFKG